MTSTGRGSPHPVGLPPVLAALLAALLAGCVGDNTISTSHVGDGPGLYENEVTCGDGGAHLEWKADAVGVLTIRVQDPNGDTAFVEAYNGSTEVDERQDLDGPAGTWSVAISRGSDFDGTYAMTLGC